MTVQAFVEPLLFNAATATLLALVAALVGKRTRRPGLAHALWALVLAKLLFPPVIEMAVVPRAATAAGTTLAAAASGPAASAAAFLRGAEPASDPQNATAPVAWPEVAVGAWAAGSLFLLGLTWWRVLRFRRLVAAGRPVPREFSHAARALSRRMGVRAPDLRMVAARFSPLLWCPGRRPTLLFPAALLDRLDGDERDALLAHEIAHLRRRDHLLRFVELLATVAFWWHPVVWWARQSLRRLEEQSCDAEVLRSLPGQGAPYARGLVKTVEFLAGPRTPLPALASSAVRKGAARHLEERLTMILNDTPPRMLSRTQRLLLACAAGVALLIVPSWADPPATAARDEQAIEEDYHERLRDIERRELELERNLQELDARRREIELERAQLERERNVDALRERAAAVEREGDHEQAELLRREAELAADRAVREREVARLESDQLRRARELELELRRHQIAAELAAAGGEEPRILERTQSLIELQRQAELQQRELAEVEAPRGLHREKAAAEVDRILALELERRAAEEALARHAAIIAKLRALRAEAAHFASIGDNARAAALLRDVERLEEKLAAERDLRSTY